MDGNQRTLVVCAVIFSLIISGIIYAIRTDGQDKQDTQRLIAESCTKAGKNYTIVGRDESGSVVMGCK